MALDRVIAGDATVAVPPCPEGETVITVAALLAPVAIPAWLFSHRRFTAASFDAALRGLAEVSLISVGEDARGETGFTAHRIVQAIMRDRLGEVRRTDQIIKLSIDLLVTALLQKSGDFTNWATCQLLTPSALELLRVALDDCQKFPSASLLAFNLAKYLQQVGRYREAEPLLQRSPLVV